MPPRKPAAKSAAKADAVRLVDAANAAVADFIEQYESAVPAPRYRLTLDNPPPEFASMRRAQQKPLIARANALIDGGMSTADAIAAVLAS